MTEDAQWALRSLKAQMILSKDFFMKSIKSARAMETAAGDGWANGGDVTMFHLNTIQARIDELTKALEEEPV
jgi:hypothetical protein